MRRFVARFKFVTVDTDVPALPYWPYRRPLGAIGENRKDLGNTNIQVRNLKGFTPKPAEMAEY